MILSTGIYPAQANLMGHFRDCLRGIAAPLVTAEEALSDLRVIAAAYASSQDGGKAVKLSR